MGSLTSENLVEKILGHDIYDETDRDALGKQYV